MYTSATELNPQDQALLELGYALRERDYRFITITPESHRRVNARAGNQHPRSLRDIFGWSRCFQEDELEPVLLALLHKANAVQTDASGLRSSIRFATLADSLYVHSAYPTLEHDAVFFGPDSYRFAALVARVLAARNGQSTQRIVDIGCGAGPGGIVAASVLRQPGYSQLTLADINPQALRFARINSLLAGVKNTELTLSDVLQSVSGDIDLIVANPPYLVDAAARYYRDGGGLHGCDLALRIVRESLHRLSPGGQLILYTGTPVIAGLDTFFSAVQPLLTAKRITFDYNEIDPDVFGEELATPAYAAAERIAVVALVIQVQ